MTAPAGSKAERIGLLFVHGIGEQKRFEHLKTSAQEYAELLRQGQKDAIVTVTDRTENWPHPAGTPAPPGSGAPITISFFAPKVGSVNDPDVPGTPRHVHFECHEVWWADLGTRSGLGDVITFWLWGLGQWGAPMYREIDASGLAKTGTSVNSRNKAKAVPKLARLPETSAGKFRDEPLVRVKLAAAALAAALVAVGWMLIKRLFQAALGQAPSPTLLVQYVGDVRTYEARWTPGDSNLSDPGHPRRVAIRRRMVAEMVAMGTRAHNGEIAAWYVCAHSLGTVVAYNGLTEIGHTLPNYLSEDQWNTLPAALKTDAGCELRDAGEMHLMMPSRPDWLADKDVVNRLLLFDKLRGILTYGSPLDKFAALWPRIVATATDRKKPTAQHPDLKVSPFHESCEWINYSDPVDPVAGTLESYHVSRAGAIKDSIPKVLNVVTPTGWFFGIAHIRYFLGIKDEDVSFRSRQKRAMMTWMLERATAPFPATFEPPKGELANDKEGQLIWLWRLIGYGFILTMLAAIVAGLWWAVFVAGDQLFSETAHKVTFAWKDSLQFMFRITGGMLALVTAFGLLRWYQESRMNWEQAERERAKAKERKDAELEEALWQQLSLMSAGQTFAGLAFLILFAALFILFIAGLIPSSVANWLWEWPRTSVWEWLRPTVELLWSRLYPFADWLRGWLRPAGLCLIRLGEFGWGSFWPLMMALIVGAASLMQTLLNKIVAQTDPSAEETDKGASTSATAPAALASTQL